MSKIIYEADLGIMEDIIIELNKELRDDNNYNKKIDIDNRHQFALEIAPKLKLTYRESKEFLKYILDKPDKACNLFSENSKNYSKEFVTSFSKFLKIINVKENSYIVDFAKIINKNDFQYPFLEQIKIDFPEFLKDKLSNKQQKHIIYSTRNLINIEEYELNSNIRKDLKNLYKENLIENITSSLRNLIKTFPSQRVFSDVFSLTQKSERTTTQSKITTLLNGSWLRYIGTEKNVNYNKYEDVNKIRLEFISDFYNFLGVPKKSELVHLTKISNNKFNYNLKINKNIQELPTIYNLKNGEYKKKNLNSSKKEVLEKIISDILIGNDKIKEYYKKLN